MMYTKIIAAIMAEAAENKEEAAAHIENSADALKRHSTETRWRQYDAGEISRPQCEKYAIERTARRIDKETAAAVELAKTTAEAPTINMIDISVHWTRDGNPHATIKAYTDRGTFTAHGSAYGGNYNKESAAIAEALNAIPVALKIIYNQRENGLYIYGTKTTHAAPKFEGGTGITQLERIFEASDIHRISSNHTKTDDYYYFERSANHE